VGESQARRWQWLATWHFRRNRGKETLQPLEPWLKIGLGGGFLAMYGGQGLQQGVGVVLLTALGAELLMFLFGMFDHKAGVIERQQQWNNEQDKVKMETLATLRKILAALEAR
jgi:hypothetical protein